jgi:hypothetical protein
VQPFAFLSALPALLGLAGFVLYQVLGANKSGDEISRRIIEKLRTSLGDEVPPDRRLTPKQVERILEHRQRFRKLVGEHDFHLLKQALTQQFIITILVYVLALGFCAWSVHLFVQSTALPQKAKDATGEQIHNSQNSTGKNAPNVISSGSAPVTVTIQDQAAPKPGTAKPENKKK